MKSNQKLIDTLRTVADAIESNEYWDEQDQKDVFWDWNDPKRCNMGLVARELGVKEEEIKNAHIYGFWYMSYRYHLKSKLPLSSPKRMALTKIFNTLFSNGLEPQDIKTIEFCGGEVTDEEKDEFGNWYDNTEEVAENTVAWMRDKANLLEHKLLENQQNEVTEVSVKATN